MNFEIIYHDLVSKNDIPSLPKTTRARIKNAIGKKLTTEPDKYGKPLRRSLKGYRKLRVGDYRIIFRIEEKRVKIFLIQHRSVVYDKAEARIFN